MKLNTFVLSLLAVLLCSCSQPAKEDPRFKAVLNPTPHYFITYKGFIDPSLNHLVKLTILTVYNTTHPDCEIDTNQLAGVSVPREQLLYTYVTPDANGRFSYQVPLDKYLTGYCNWVVSWTNYNDQSIKFPNQYVSAELFTNNKKNAAFFSKEIINYSCTSKQCAGEKSLLAPSDKAIPDFENHILEFNYYRKSHDNS
jgi:hypothetical protein